MAVAGGELHEAEPVAKGIETERLGVDRNRAAHEASGRQVATMQGTG